MYKSNIQTYEELILIFESALNECKDYADRQYYENHIEHFKKKIKELGG